MRADRYFFILLIDQTARRRKKRQQPKQARRADSTAQTTAERRSHVSRDSSTGKLLFKFGSFIYVHPCESKIALALNFDAYFLRLILIFLSFLHIKLVLGLKSITLAKHTAEIYLNCMIKNSYKIQI